MRIKLIFFLIITFILLPLIISGCNQKKIDTSLSEVSDSTSSVVVHKYVTETNKGTFQSTDFTWTLLETGQSISFTIDEIGKDYDVGSFRDLPVGEYHIIEDIYYQIIVYFCGNMVQNQRNGMKRAMNIM